MTYTIKNRPKYPHSIGYDKKADEWFEGFEKQMQRFRESKIVCIEWLQKYTMINPLDAMKLTECQAIIRTFIEKEILG